MAIETYLAMTAAEMRINKAIPDNLGYMACHFSPYGTGLSNLPDTLPEGSMLILNDRIPWYGHDAARITNQLAQLADTHKFSSVLLDFQRDCCEDLAELSRNAVSMLPCPVGVSLPYAQGIDCPVFLPPVPPDMPLNEYLQPWQGREIWLEAALDALEITLTENGAVSTPLPYAAELLQGHRDAQLHCHYRINIAEYAHFTLFRTREDLESLFEEAEALCVTRAVGLWQELGR